MKLLINHKIFASNDIEEIGHYQLIRDPLNDTYTVTDLTDDLVVQTNLTYTHAKSLANELVESEMSQMTNKTKDDAADTTEENQPPVNVDNNRRHTYRGIVDVMLRGNVYITNYTMETTAVSIAQARNNFRHRFEVARANGEFPEECYLGEIHIAQIN